MIQQFTTKRDVLGAFANAMNLISPDVGNHHEKVAYIAYRIAEEMGMTEQQRMLALSGGLLHDVGGVLKRGDFSLADLEMSAGQIARTGAGLLRAFAATTPYADVVYDSQTPWERLRQIRKNLRTPALIGQIVHLADAVSLMLGDSLTVLSQIGQVREMVRCGGDREFSPDVLAAFESLCGKESVWMDVMYRPQYFLDLITDNRWISLDEAVELTDLMSKIVDFRSPFTAMHSAGVAATASALAELIGMSDDECKMMRIAGYLHDIGKLRIPNEILEKPGKLTPEEFSVMKEHAYFTWIILKDVRGFDRIMKWAAFHHEKLNGNGYPFHLQGSELVLGSRIMMVADIFSALTEVRPYRGSMEKDGVLGILGRDAKDGLISDIVVRLLADHYEEINERRETESRAASRKYQESVRQADGREAGARDARGGKTGPD